MQIQLPPLIRALQNPDLYEPRPGNIEVAETHISWVLLTGTHAYKIKKPVDLGFLDYTSLEKRRFFCEEELRLNRRFAPELYEGLIRITGTPERPSFGEDRPALEYMIKMKQFPAPDQWDRQLEKGLLTPAHLMELGKNLAAIHRRSECASAAGSAGYPGRVWGFVQASLDILREAVKEAGRPAFFEELAGNMKSRFLSLENELSLRYGRGFVRECHGDLHLRNIAFFEGKPVLFDALEFDPQLRFIDVMNEAAFLCMDLEARGRADLAWFFLNAYLEAGGGYEGMKLFRFFKAYRALVRAKVGAIRMRQNASGFSYKEKAWREVEAYLSLAEASFRGGRPVLFLTHGVSGSGKTTFSRWIAAAMECVHLRSDVERKRLLGLEPHEKTAVSEKAFAYGPEMNAKVSDRLYGLADGLLDAGYSVIVDAVFLRRESRDLFRKLAAGRQSRRFLMLDFQADREELELRIAQRIKSGGDASEADLEVLRQQLAGAEPFSSDETEFVQHIDTRLDPAKVDWGSFLGSGMSP